MKDKELDASARAQLRYRLLMDSSTTPLTLSREALMGILDETQWLQDQHVAQMRFLDAIREALGQPKEYQPDQLPGMVRELRNALTTASADLLAVVLESSEYSTSRYWVDRIIAIQKDIDAARTNSGDVKEPAEK